MLELAHLEQNVPLAPYTTYAIGGPADYFLRVSTKEELVEAVTQARKNKTPYFILGTGANILVGDRGFRGLVIKNEAQHTSIISNSLTVESGATIEELITLTSTQGLSGLEHFAGIPSTVGGALRQNLHFLSPDRKETLYIGDLLESAEILDEENKLSHVGKEFFKFGYAFSVLHERNLLVTEATFTLQPKDSALITHQAQENLAWRNAKQPQLPEFPSCGSVFKKIEGVGAGRLIDQAGLKGHRVGKAEVSEKHANYIVNLGGATAKNVTDLISLVQKEVLNKTGYHLEPEIGFVGEF